MEKIKIMIVDDKDDILKKVWVALAGEGYEVSCFKDPKMAIGTMNSLGPDLVIIDLNMPQMKGDAVAEIIRAKFPGVKIIIWSSNIAPSDISKYQNKFSGVCDRFLKKGTEPENLKAIKELLGK